MSCALMSIPMSSFSAHSRSFTAMALNNCSRVAGDTEWSLSESVENTEIRLSGLVLEGGATVGKPRATEPNWSKRG